MSHIDIFTNIYETCAWGDNKNSNYRGTSGGGSDPEFNMESYIPFLKKFIHDNSIQTVVDLGCGDFRCGKYIYTDLDIQYTGYDAYAKVVEHNTASFPSDKYSFIHLDILNNKESIKGGDLCILKDILQHWHMDEIYRFMDYITETNKFKYILLVNCCNQKEDNPDNSQRSLPLSAKYLPLKKYSPQVLFNYFTKEVSLIAGEDHLFKSLE